MKKLLLIALLLFYGNIAFPLTLQKTIPANATYGGINIQDNLNDLIYKVLSPNLRSSLYPNGLNASGIQAIITGLKRLDVKDIEFFTSDDWNMLVKVNTPRFEEIVQLFAALLDGEGFMTKTQRIDARNITITSKNPDLAGNTFFVKKEKQYVLIASNKMAISAWDTKNTPVTLYSQGLQAIKKNNVFGFLYGIDNFYSNNKPVFVTTSSNDRADFLNISQIQKTEKPQIIFPTFLKDNPLFFLTSTKDLDAEKMTKIKAFLAPSFVFLPGLRVPLNILLSPGSGAKRMAMEFKDGNLVSINEKKYNELDMAFTFQFASSQKMENILTSQLKSNKAFNFKVDGSKNQRMFTLTPKVPAATAKAMGLFPVYFVLNSDGFLGISMNKKTILELANNMTNAKKVFEIDHKDQSAILFADVANLVDRFPILNSLISQFGIDFKALKTIYAPNHFEQIDPTHIETKVQITFNKN